MKNEYNNRLPEGQKFEVFGQMMTESEYDAWSESGLADWQTQENMQRIARLNLC